MTEQKFPAWGSDFRFMRNIDARELHETAPKLAVRVNAEAGQRNELDWGALRTFTSAEPGPVRDQFDEQFDKKYAKYGGLEGFLEEQKTWELD